MEMSYASPSHKEALFAVGIILFVMIVLLNVVAQAVMKRFGGAAS
jgi:phosphate transport system permease protein